MEPSAWLIVSSTVWLSGCIPSYRTRSSQESGKQGRKTSTDSPPCWVLFQMLRLHISSDLTALDIITSLRQQRKCGSNRSSHVQKVVHAATGGEGVSPSSVCLWTSVLSKNLQAWSVIPCHETHSRRSKVRLVIQTLLSSSYQIEMRVLRCVAHCLGNEPGEIPTPGQWGGAAAFPS